MGRVEAPAAAPRRKGGRDPLWYFIEDPATGTLYKRGQLLGQGAFGRCYKFTDTSTNKVYAGKVVPRSGVSGLDHPGKVDREAELHRQLRHPNVVGFHRHFADEENVYLVLEYCSRKSLAHVLRARKALTEPEVRFYLRQVLAGLQYLHRQGIIHRDLKLSNLFLTSRMRVKIGDLGLAVREQQAGRRRGAVVCGTPGYLAPEVLARKGHSFQSDVWALGCIMYTALTGSSPFEGLQKPERFQRIREGRYPAPRHLSPHARELIGKLLAPDPAARPSLEEALSHPFFTQGFTPDRLSPRACHSAPPCTLAGPLRKLFRKVTQLLFRGGPCGESRAESPEPREYPRRPPADDPPLPVGPSDTEGGKGDTATEGDPGPFPIHLLMRSSLKGSRRGTGGEAGRSPGGVVEALESTLQACLRTVPLVAESPPGQPRAQPVRLVTKWVDYSNKYGFGYLRSDGVTGVLLADGTHLALCPRRQRVSYSAGGSRAASFPRAEVPTPLSAKMDVLQFFARFMQQRLLEGSPRPAGPAASAEDDPLLLHFAKSKEALLMVFSDRSLQANFHQDHTKIALSRSGGQALLTFVDRQRRIATFPLEALARDGWAPPLRERVLYTLHMLRCL